MESFGFYLDQMRSQAPLVHNITNFVAMNSMANVLLAAGASPAMVHSLEEVESFASISSALTVNIGTLEPDWVHAMLLAARQMNVQNKPWVFDPVGVGATTYRKEVSKRILELNPSVIRGNGSEILALAGLENSGQGVDSGDSSLAAADAAHSLAKAHGSIVVVTGATDLVTDGTRTLTIPHGSPYMTRVTTLGCSLNGVIAAFCVNQSYFDATAAALTYYGIAGEQAEKKARGPGSFWVEFIDTLAALNGADVDRLARTHE